MPRLVGLLPMSAAMPERKNGKPVLPVGSAAIHWNNGWLEGAPDPRTEGTAEGH